MVLTKPELIASLQNEVRILLHLASKIDSETAVNYRPSPKQRSTLELLKYLSVMGPGLIRAAKTGAMDRAAWTAATETAKQWDLAQTLAAIATHSETYATLLGEMSDADFRGELEMFGNKTTRGAFIVNMVLCGCAAYRTQLFVYLKACGRDELNTANLWGGIDPPTPN